MGYKTCSQSGSGAAPVYFGDLGRYREKIFCSRGLSLVEFQLRPVVVNCGL